jgi:hypothetical protein
VNKIKKVPNKRSAMIIPTPAIAQMVSVFTFWYRFGF